MEFIYTDPSNQYAIGEQGLMLVIDGKVYSIYRKYVNPEQWVPFKMIGPSLEQCFKWLREKSIISNDEMKYQISLIKNG